jgi:pullulanase
MSPSLRGYFEAAALGNGNLGRFVELSRGLKKRAVAFHFLIVSLALFFPVMFAVARLSPWDFYSRLYGESPAAGSSFSVEEFNNASYASGYAGKVLLPALLLSFGIVLVLQGAFYLCAAGFLGLRRMTRSRFSFRERFNLFVMGSTLPVLGSLIFGIFVPTVHILVFYLAVTLLGFHASEQFDRYEKAASLSAAGFDSREFAEKYTYNGDDLGANYSLKKTTFKVWAPGADSVEALLFAGGRADGRSDGGREKPLKRIPLKNAGRGVWAGKAAGDWKNTYYVYAITRSGETKQAVDPYARALGVNGWRGMIIDLPSTDPPGFREQERPPLESPVDAVIYELHIRDLSMHPESGIQNKGKFLGLAERGTKNAAGLSTGLDHIRELGVTHIHLLPSFDYKTVDEANPAPQFNWGYDPQNYNAPEGSYSTDPYKGETRVLEFKEMVGAVHRSGLRVVMDVVYNHTFDGEKSNFSILVPGYYYRQNPDGSYSDGSACGNETASDRSMMRKFIIDSVVYWAAEYKIDGFRFDLMGLHDIETMNQVRAALDRIDPTIIVYGEGWTAADSPLPLSRRALKENAPALHERIAFFSDDMRDGVKGSVFIPEEGGFVNAGMRDSDVKFGIAASVRHDGVDIQNVRYSRLFWAKEPAQTVNYVSVHDNLTLWDKLVKTNPGAGGEELLRQNKLAAAIVLTSQGIPLFQAGEEMARTKKGDENSFRSPDSVNQLDWERKTRFAGLVDYYRGLIELRRRWPCFRLRTADEIRRRLRFLPGEKGLIVYTLDNSGGEAAGYAAFTVIFNGLSETRQVELPPGLWDILVNGEAAGTKPLARAALSAPVPGKTAMVLGSQEFIPFE